jgi:lantibiotic leader peptide-processing serine protease
MKRPLSILAVIAAVVAALASSLPATATPARSYLIIAQDNSLPASLAVDVAAAGGSITNTIPEIGVAAASSSSADFQSRAAGISGVRSVVPNLVRHWLGPVSEPVEDANPPSSGDDDARFQLQWGLDAIDAPEAWNAGYRGAGARVAVLDSGIASANPDIAPNLNTALSTSFVPGEAYDFIPPPATRFNHGTHVAGIVAAADNTVGTVGVAPSAEIVAVKVLSAATGSGTFEGVVAGIVYAANIDADVINMSLGSGPISRRGYLDDMGTPDPSDDVFVTAAEVAELVQLVGRATTYAFQQGTTIINSAGNEAIDFDQTADVIVLPAMAPHVNAVSALAPEGWCADQSTNLDLRASYTNIGRSVIAFGAPGGDFDFPPTFACTVLTAGGPVTRQVWVFDGVFSPGNTAVYFWASGTSMAAPHVTGVAALIIGKNGGSMSPSGVVSELRSSADDLGQPGNDATYGAGRVNAFNAVR